MKPNNDFVLVQKSLYDSLRYHCEHCHGFYQRLQDSPDSWVISVPSRSPGVTSPKWKTPPESGSQGLSDPWKRLKQAKVALSWFIQNLQNLPKDWRKRQIDLGLKTVEQYEGVVRALGNCVNINTESSRGDENSEDELVNLAERFALLMRNSLTNAKLQRSFALFQVLILLSYCEVLRTLKDVPYETIDGIIKHIAAQENDRKKLLKSALWINGIINDLVSNGWTMYRATELFFIGMFSKFLTREAELIFTRRAFS